MTLNRLTLRKDRLERLRTICLALPETTEKVTWGDPTWRIRNRIFAMQKGNYSGGRPSVWLKAPEGAQDVLVGIDPERFFVPPYVGHKGWIGVYLDGKRVDWAWLSGLIEESYRLIAPRRLAARLDPASTRQGEDQG
jgi:predicted DNA-binding protein (MmcQ/YjbR family)